MPATTGMKGAGYYDRNSTVQMSAIQALEGWVDEAVASVPLPARPRPITVLDLGSSEGGNAIRLMASVAEGLLRRTDQPVQTIYSDLATNDFNRLFINLEEDRVAGPPAANVYPGAVAGSFYEPLVVPERSTSRRASTPSTGSTDCRRSPRAMVPSTAGLIPGDRSFPRRRRSPRPSSGRPSGTWSDS